MRFARFRRQTVIVMVVLGVWILVWAFGPEVGLAIPFGTFVPVALLIVAVSVVLLIRLMIAVRGDALRVVAAHQGAVAFPTTVISWPGDDREERESVIVVVGDERGLSFRDHDDREVRLVPADRLMSLDLAPLVPRSPVRPFRAKTVDGVIDFSGTGRPDAQVEAVMALRGALKGTGQS
jgi:hypothetical protein